MKGNKSINTGRAVPADHWAHLRSADGSTNIWANYNKYFHPNPDEKPPGTGPLRAVLWAKIKANQRFALIPPLGHLNVVVGFCYTFW